MSVPSNNLPSWKMSSRSWKPLPQIPSVKSIPGPSAESDEEEEEDYGYSNAAIFAGPYLDSYMRIVPTVLPNRRGPIQIQSDFGDWLWSQWTERKNLWDRKERQIDNNFKPEAEIRAAKEQAVFTRELNEDEGLRVRFIEATQKEAEGYAVQQMLQDVQQLTAKVREKQEELQKLEEELRKRDHDIRQREQALHAGEAEYARRQAEADRIFLSTPKTTMHVHLHRNSPRSTISSILGTEDYEYNRQHQGGWAVDGGEMHRTTSLGSSFLSIEDYEQFYQEQLWRSSQSSP